MSIEHYDNDSIFSMPQELENIWHGINKFDIQQVLPDGGMPTGAVVGQGNSSGTLSFSWNSAGNEWWSPVNSYFFLKLRIGKWMAGTPNFLGQMPIFDANGNLLPGDLVTYCDNFVSTFFSTIMTYINQNVVDNVTQPWIPDQVLTYSNAKKNFLDTFGSLARVGEPLQQRLINTWGTGGPNQAAVLEVCYRPPCSLYNVNLIPPGAYHKIDFTWNQNCINAFESLIGSIDNNVGTNVGNYNIIVDGFYFYKATCTPSPAIPLPMHGVIPLSACTVKQYPISGTNQYQQNITLAPTTNRVYMALQDISQNPKVTTQTSTTVSPYRTDSDAIRWMGVGTGWNPATSFSKSFSSSTAGNPPFLVELKQLYLQISDLSLILPHPPYNFSADKTDYMRAYMDWCNCVGTKYNSEGSVPFGTAIPTANTVTNTWSSLNIPGTTTIYPNTITGVTPTPLTKVGNPSNDQQLNFITNSTFAYPAGTNGYALYFQTYENGWLGRHPGPIFAYNICRGEGSKVSQGDFTVSFTGNVNSVIVNILCAFNMALAVSRNAQGKYDFQLVSGQ
jgi:hypothetical protein